MTMPLSLLTALNAPPPPIFFKDSQNKYSSDLHRTSSPPQKKYIIKTKDALFLYI